jgi:hypothetical protein
MIEVKVQTWLVVLNNPAVRSVKEAFALSYLLWHLRYFIQHNPSKNEWWCYP